MKPNPEQEKALREKIKKQTAEHVKPELRPLDTSSINEELKAASRKPGKRYKSHNDLNLNNILVFIVIGMMLVGALFYFLF